MTGPWSPSPLSGLGHGASGCEWPLDGVRIRALLTYLGSGKGNDSHKQYCLHYYHFKVSRWASRERGSCPFRALSPLAPPAPGVESNRWVQGEAAAPWHPKPGDAFFTSATEPSFFNHHMLTNARVSVPPAPVAAQVP